MTPALLRPASNYLYASPSTCHDRLLELSELAGAREDAGAAVMESTGIWGRLEDEGAVNVALPGDEDGGFR